MFRTAKIFTTTIPEVSRLPQGFCFAEKEAARRPTTGERTVGQIGTFATFRATQPFLIGRIVVNQQLREFSPGPRLTFRNRPPA